MVDEPNENQDQRELDPLSPWMTKTCEMCGTRFYRIDYSSYQYKIRYDGRDHFYCRYNCWRKAQKELQKRQEELKHLRH